MKNNKIYELLSTFSREELRGFEKFISSVYFNRGRNYAPLLKELKKFHPGFDNKKINNEYLYSRLYPGRRYNDQVIRNMFTGLTRIAKDYIVYTSSVRDKTNYYALLANEFQNRGLIKLAEKYVTYGKNELNKNAVKDKNYFRQLFELYRVSREINSEKNDTKGNINSLSNESTYFLFYIIMEMSRHLEEMTVLRHNFNADFTGNLIYSFIANLNFDNLLEFSREKSVEDRTLLELYCTNIQLQINDRSEVLFEKLRALLKQNFNVLSRWGKYNLFTCLQNACIRLQAVNEEKYSRMLLEVYSDQLKAGLYSESEGSPLSQNIFRNIIINALKLSEYDWTEQFIKQYIQKLPAGSKENMYNFSYSLLNFEKRNFENALNYIIKVKYDTFVFKLDIKVLMLKIYHELNYTEQEISMLDTFRHFILENVSISEFIKLFHLNFVKFLHEIIKVKNGSKEINPNKLKKEIINASVRGKEWLLEKTAEQID